MVQVWHTFLVQVLWFQSGEIIRPLLESLGKLQIFIIAPRRCRRLKALSSVTIRAFGEIEVDTVYLDFGDHARVTLWIVSVGLSWHIGCRGHHIVFRSNCGKIYVSI